MELRETVHFVFVFDSVEKVVNRRFVDPDECIATNERVRRVVEVEAGEHRQV